MRMIRLAAALLCLVFLWGCAEPAAGDKISVGELAEPSAENGSAVEIVFSSLSARINGEGAEFSEGVLTVRQGGVYTLSGSLEGGIVVDAPKTEKVELQLCGLTVENKSSSAIYIKSADKAILYLKNGTVNTLADGEDYCISDDVKPSACIYSADDIEIKGEGELLVYAKCRNGIQTKNDLRIKGGSITVAAPKNALKGKDSVEISGGNIRITGAKDGIKSDNEKEEGRGVVSISGGTVDITCRDDGIQAYRSLQISGSARVKISAGDKSLNCDGELSVGDGCLVE